MCQEIDDNLFAVCLKDSINATKKLLENNIIPGYKYEQNSNVKFGLD